MEIREPAVAGMFYSSNKEELEQEIKDCFLNDFGPKGLPSKKSNKKIYGVISPHAGYQFSGACMAHVYKELAESSKVNTYVIIGINHSGLGGNIVTLDIDFKTPLGVVKVDKEFIAKLLKTYDRIQLNKFSHLSEHSIEVQLPFLQYINKEDFSIVPILVSNPSLDESKELAKAITSINKNICVIASSDFTHYGFSYGYVPFAKDIKKNMYKLDKEAIDYIKKLDSKGFYGFVKKKQATICGTIPITIAIESCKLLGAKKARLLKYYTSGDVVNNYNNAVGYASLVFE